ncbi:bifunctional adenosylcobinamide kinase/adenosylcobinamide-phosphate guanylyltransferase [Undibacterium sp. TJN19]|uniref:bifunctional adenosylcobinamide kinase/adenosylcobinamide-phosphate guanylyltransferase n=1 Tax=Undibacterium sp. TJN19 TaxID=3413055 RepID=UPI003BF35466
MTRILIFGGARSGKSAYAEQLAKDFCAAGKSVIYVATAITSVTLKDEEMQQRIAHHRVRRPAHWITVEEALELGSLIRTHSKPDTVLLIDCLTVWLSNLLFSENRDYPEMGQVKPPEKFTYERQTLLDALAQAAGDIILVSNEVGMGIVPMGAVSRWFVDEAGRLNQAVAKTCDQVVWVAAGLPLYLKGQSC